MKRLWEWAFGWDSPEYRSFICAMVLVISLCFGLVLGIATLVNTFNVSPGNAAMTGRVIAVSRSGLFCTTDEAIIVTGGLTAGSGTAGVEKFTVTLTDSDQVAAFTKHMIEKTPVDFEFVRKGMYSWCSSASGGDFVTKVK